MYAFFILSSIFFLILDCFKKNNAYISLATAFIFASILLRKYPQNIYISVASIPIFFLIFNVFINKILKNEECDKNKKKNSKNLIGKTALVTKDIGKNLSIDGIGQIKLDKTYWRAKNITDTEIKAGKRVEVVSFEDMVINVRAK